MSELTGLPIADVRLPGAAVDYVSSNEKARRVLGFRPRHSMEDMLTVAVQRWQARKELR
jgi:UDP-glucose 4-epimerase